MLTGDTKGPISGSNIFSILHLPRGGSILSKDQRRRYTWKSIASYKVYCSGALSWAVPREGSLGFRQQFPWVTEASGTDCFSLIITP